MSHLEMTVFARPPQLPPPRPKPRGFQFFWLRRGARPPASKRASPHGRWLSPVWHAMGRRAGESLLLLSVWPQEGADVCPIVGSSPLKWARQNPQRGPRGARGLEGVVRVPRLERGSCFWRLVTQKRKPQKDKERKRDESAKRWKKVKTHDCGWVRRGLLIPPRAEPRGRVAPPRCRNPCSVLATPIRLEQRGV